MKRRLIATLLVLTVLCALLAGCGENVAAKLEGTWSTSIEMKDYYNAELEGSGLEDYLAVDTFPVTVNYTFKSDGTYAVALDTAALQDILESVKGSLRDGMYRYAQDVIEEEGLSISAEELFEFMELDLDATIEELCNEINIDEMAESMSAEGNYKVRGERIHLSDSLDHLVDPEVYDLYELEGDTLTIRDHVGGETNDLVEAMYPIVLKKVG